MTRPETAPPSVDIPSASPGEGATTPGPCPTCGHHGPRFILCGDPICRHSDVLHELKKDGSRGRCTVHTGPRCVPCPCTTFTELPESETSS